MEADRLYKPDLIKGRAAASATKAYFERLSKTHRDYNADSWYDYHKCIDLFASKTGYGCYRIAAGNAEHRDSLREAFISGTNLADTSSNYTDGHSEALVGNVIRELTGSNRIAREELIIVSKGGYIQGSNLEAVRHSKDPAFETVQYNDYCWHSIAPEFLEGQIRASRKRLGLATIDIYLLHNPEYYLLDAKNRGTAPDEAGQIYKERLKKAFDFLEEKVSEGVIGCYGVSSNTFVTYGQYESTDLDMVLKTAGPNFRCIQFPANPLETGFLRLKGKTGNLFVLSNRPLNAFLPEKGMIRLAASGHFERTREDPADRMLRIEDELIGVEEKLLELLKKRRFTFSQKVPAASNLLKQFNTQVHMPEHASQVRPALAGSVQKTIEELSRVYSIVTEKHSNAEASETRRALEAYVRLCNAGIAHFQKYIRHKYDLSLEPLTASLPENDLPLSIQTIRSLTGTGIIDTVLLGMRRIAYVRQAAKVYKLNRISTPDSEEIFRLIQRFYGIRP